MLFFNGSVDYFLGELYLFFFFVSSEYVMCEVELDVFIK